MDAVMANRRDMRIAVVASEDREQHRRQHGALLRRVIAVVGEWAIGHPRLEDAAHLEKLDEEGQLAEWRDGRSWIPLDVDRPPKVSSAIAPVCPANALRVASPMG